MLVQNKRLLAVALSLAVVLATTGFDLTSLAATKLENQYSHAWWTVKKHTPFKPGLNIRRLALLSGHRASAVNLRQEINRLKRLEQKSALSVTPATGLAQCIIKRESSGNPQAVNGQYTGIAQWSLDSWRRSGGTRYASTPLGASKSEQIDVLNHALAKGMEGEWRPYDGC